MVIRPVGWKSAAPPVLPLSVAQASRATNPDTMRCKRDMKSGSPSGFGWNSPRSPSMPRRAADRQRESTPWLQRTPPSAAAAGMGIARTAGVGSASVSRVYTARRSASSSAAAAGSMAVIIRVAARAWRLPLSADIRSWVIASPLSRPAPSRRGAALVEGSPGAERFARPPLLLVEAPPLLRPPQQGQPLGKDGRVVGDQLRPGQPLQLAEEGAVHRVPLLEACPGEPPGPPALQVEGSV